MASALHIMFRGSFARTGMMMMSNQTLHTIRRKAAPAPLVRKFASGTGGKGGSNAGMWAALTVAGVGCGYYVWTTQEGGVRVSNRARSVSHYQKVYDAIAKLLDDSDYDDGSYGPIFVRLAWHASGTYDKSSEDGGSSKGTMRFEPESRHHANAGLQYAREKLESVKDQFPWISHGDLWTLAGVVGVQEMGGPTVVWRPGRIDGCAKDCPPDGRLPDGGNPTAQHPRDVFYRMGFNDQEIVALVGAHSLGRCHSDRSGFDGRWTNAPTSFSNLYYVELLNRKWVAKQWNGPNQFVDKESGELMMLPADMAFANDKEFRNWVETYAKDEKKYFEDFAKAYKKLLELGVPFREGTPEMTFKLAA